MDNTLREFFNNHRAEIESKSYVKIYEDLYDLDDELRDEFSKILDSVGINPLLYMEEIPENSFDHSGSLRFLKNPHFNEELKSIKQNAFYGCKNMERVALPPYLISIGGSAFGSSGIQSVLSTGVGTINIRYWAFEGCTDLREVDLSSYTGGSINTGAFEGCSKLEKVVLPQSVEYIPSNAFADCRSLKSIWLPDGLERVGLRAFMGCEALESIRIPKSISRIRKDALRGCDRLKEVRFGGSEEDFINALHNNITDEDVMDKLRTIDIVFEK